MGAGNKRGYMAKDRKQFNNKLLGSSRSPDGLELIFQLIILAIAGLIYGAYKFYKKYKNKK